MIEKKIAKYIYIFAILFAIGAIIFFPKWVVDDAYIIFRYSENLVRHFQLTYNINANPIEGYTGIMLPILIAVAMLAGIAPVFAAHLIGVVSFFIGGLFLFLIFRKMNINEIVSAITILLYSTSAIIYTHIFSGLETILFSSTIIVVIYFSFVLLCNDKPKTSNYIAYGLLLLFLSLIRPEGILFSCLISGFCLLYYLAGQKYYFKKYIISLITVFVIPFIIYYLWRWNYYGQLFPNTYYLKTGNFNFSHESYKSFVIFFKQYFSLPFLISLLFVLINVDNAWEKIKNDNNKILPKEILYVLLPTILFTIILLFEYFHTNLLMDFSHRFFIPTVPLFLILFALLLNIGYKNYLDLILTSPLTFKVYSIVLLLFLIIHITSIVPKFKQEVTSDSRFEILLNKVHIPAGNYIKRHFNKNLTLLVHADAGAIPYFAKLKTIDFGGLNDNYLSHRDKLSDKQIINYFFNVNADVLSITSFQKNRIQRINSSLNWETLKEIIKDKRFHKYTLVKIFGTPLWNYYEFVFVKNKLLENKNAFNPN